MSLGEGVIGIIVALLSLIVTIILGWQIYTAIDVKEKIAVIDELQNNQEHKMEQMYDNTCRAIGCAMAAIMDRDKLYVHSYRWLLSALAHSLQTDKPIDVEKLLCDLNRHVKLIEKGTILEENFLREIEESDKRIRGNSSFSCISSKYEEIQKEFIARINTTEH